MCRLFDFQPSPLGEGLGRSWYFIEATNRHRVTQIHVGRLDRALNGRRHRRVRSADERDVSLASEKARRRTPPDPARAGQERFCPSMEVRGGSLRSTRTFRNSLVCCQLNQIARDEARRNSAMSENLHQQPCRVTAGPHVPFQSLLACLDTRIEPGYVVNLVSHHPIQVYQEADRSSRLSGKFPKKGMQPRCVPIDRKIGFEILRQLRSIFERVVFHSW